MRFDVVIIGSGLAGLTCAIKLAQEGKYCALVSSGQSALHFSSGSFDLLNSLPDGSEVTSLQESFSLLQKQAKNHPYSIIGEEKTFFYLQESEALLRRSGLSLYGSFAKNHYRFTTMGKRVKTWLSYSNMPLLGEKEVLPWKKIGIINIAGFLDFCPGIIVNSLQSFGVEATTASLSIPALEFLRENPSEFRATNIARVLEQPDNFTLFIERVKLLSQDAEAVILPACIDLHNTSSGKSLEEILQKPVVLMPTLPPSLFGASINTTLTSYFQKLGGVIMPGDTVTHFERKGSNVTKLFTKKHEDYPLVADNYVLATGSFFSKGLKSDMHNMYEAVFGLDMYSSSDRNKWIAKYFFDAQPFTEYGVKVGSSMQGRIDNTPITNVYAIGMVLGGYNAIDLGCGAGVAFVTALAAAQSILEKRVSS